ncbi:MAG: hypothetical protein ACRDP6_49690 [Actinoallomurus sp.]
MRNVKRTLATLATAAGIAAIAAGPASAAPNWQEVHTNSNWTCGATVTHSGASGVSFQTCIVLNDNYDEQAVLVVVNNGPSPITIGGSVITDFGGNATCVSSTLSPGYRRGCFGPTKHAHTSFNGAYSSLTVNRTTEHDDGLNIYL